jgi:hypothetical protein
VIRPVFQRAAYDEAKGDLGSARERLAASASATGFPPKTCEAVARLSVRMHDPTEAGRWFLLTACEDDQARKAIEFFLESHKRLPKLVLDRLPKGLIPHLRKSPFPKNLHDSVLGMGVSDPKTLLTTIPEKPPSSTSKDALGLGCLFVFALCVLSCGFGVKPMLRYFADLL